MTNYTLVAETGHVNLSPTLFHVYSRQYFQCEATFKTDARVSPVPYFLLCMAIELAIKATHLETMSRADVKKKFGHKLKKSYDQLPKARQILDSAEYAELVRANDIYIDEKGFEYVSVYHAATGLSKVPDLGILRTVAAKVIDACEMREPSTE